MTESIQSATAPATNASAEKFSCDVCNQEHDLPLSMAFALPDFVNKLLPWDRESRVKMSEDWCIVDEKFFYLRSCLEVPIESVEKPFTWGVWVTIGLNDFDQTMEMWEDPERADEPEYVGTIANTMPSYNETRNVRVLIRTRKPGERPLVLIDDANHQLHKDQATSMPRQKVIELAKFVLHGNDNNPNGYSCEK